MTRVKVWFFAMVLAAGVIGCGGDDDDGDNTPAAGTDATGGTGMTGGTGTTGGTTATTGGAGGTGAMTAMPVECGSNTCQPLSLPIPPEFASLASAFIPKVCCVEASLECGYSMQDGPCMVPPPSDERCPMSTTFPIPTCCGSDGMCGVSPMEGMCNALPGLAASFLGLTPTVCDPSLVGGDEDAGTP